MFFFSFSPTLYVGQYPHGLYAIPSLVDELTTTYASPNTGPLLLEGPALPGSTEAGSESDSAREKSQVSVNLRLPNDMKMEWIEQYHSNLGSTIKPPIILFGMSLNFYDKVVNSARSVQVSKT